MRKYVILLFMTAVMLALCACSGGEKLELPKYTDLQSITVQEIENGQPVSREVSLHDELQYRQANYQDTFYFTTKGYRKITKESQMPEKEKSIAYRFTDTDGNTRLFYVYSDKQYDYIEEPGIGIWRGKRPQRQRALYDSSYDAYERESWAQSFLDNAKDKSFTLLPEYKGTGKAIFVDISEGTVDDWVERFIPEAYVAKRAEDVRYIVLCELASKIYEGYWYVPETGEKLGDSYDLEYKARVYDLVTGESTVLVEKTINGIFEIPDYIEAYFARIE